MTTSTHFGATRLADRSVVRVSGEGAAEFLQGLLTNDVVAGPLPAYAALLTPQGKVIADMLVWGDGGDRLLDVEASRAAAIVQRLTMYRLRRPLTIAVDDRLGVHWAAEGSDGVPDSRLPALGRRWLASPSGTDASDAWRAHRLALGVTEGVAELGDATTLWLEANAVDLNGVSFTKGCYVGQENTARMNWRQKVNRRLVVVPLAEADPARQRAAYPALGWSVDHRRVDDIGPQHRPAWWSVNAP